MAFSNCTVVLTLAWCFLAGCSSVQSKPEFIRLESRPTDPQSAKRSNQVGVQLVLSGQWEQAKDEFSNAINADQTFGPAHNNLGRVYFQQRKLRLAALSFQRAIELMPERPEPINNLGLTYETAGRLNEALAMYQSAHLLEPNHPEYLGNLVRTRLRRGDRDELLRTELQRLLFVEVRPEWQKWAEYHLALSLPTHPEARKAASQAEEIATPTDWLLPPPGDLRPAPKNPSSGAGSLRLEQPESLLH